MGNNLIDYSKISVIIVAGGSGSRMGSDIPKQFLPLCGTPILMRTIKQLHKIMSNAEFIIVMNKSEFTRWNDLCIKYDFKIQHKIVEGGETRFHSVRNGINATSESADVIMIHDGVRPFVEEFVIKSALDALQETGAVIPAIDAVDSMREQAENGQFYVVNRAKFKLIQTPQVFKSEIIRESYSTDYKDVFTDDATVAENSGYKICLSKGSANNIKITSPIDMAIGEIILNNRG